MYLYKTLDHELIDVTQLSVEQKKLYQEIREYLNKKPSWNEFSNFWRGKVINVLSEKLNRDEITETSVYRICQDMEARLGVEQGYVRKADWRDKLAIIIADNFSSRYQFCKTVEIDEAFLSNVLNRKKDFSLKTLEKILEIIGYEVDIVRKESSKFEH